MRGLDVRTGLDLAGLKPSFHLKSLTKFSMFLLRGCGWSGRIGTGAVFLVSVGMPGGCQMANRWVSTMVRVEGDGRGKG